MGYQVCQILETELWHVQYAYPFCGGCYPVDHEILIAQWTKFSHCVRDHSLYCGKWQILHLKI